MTRRCFGVQCDNVGGTGGALPGARDNDVSAWPSTTDRGEPAAVWLEKFGCHLLAAESLSSDLSASLPENAPYGRERALRRTAIRALKRAEIVISRRWLADRYGIAVGDMVVRRYDSRDYSCYTAIFPLRSSAFMRRPLTRRQDTSDSARHSARGQPGGARLWKGVLLT